MIKRKEMPVDKSAEIESRNRLEKHKDAVRKEGDEYRKIKMKSEEEIARRGFI